MPLRLHFASLQINRHSSLPNSCLLLYLHTNTGGLPRPSVALYYLLDVRRVSGAAGGPGSKQHGVRQHDFALC